MPCTFKLIRTSVQGQSGVLLQQSPITTDNDSCDLLGKASEKKVLFGGKECLALVDTGSMVTSISEDFYRCNLESTHPLLEVNPNINVEGAGGNQLSFVGLIEVKLSCTDCNLEELSVPVFVMPTTSYSEHVPAIIGTNVFQRIKKLPAVTGIFREAANLLDSVDGKNMEEVNLYCSGCVTLPPRKLTVISARIGAQRSYKHGVLTAVENLPGGVGIPHSVINVDSDSRKVNICLLNVMEHQVTIPKLQHIATVHPARVIDPKVPDTCVSFVLQETNSVKGVSQKTDVSGKSVPTQKADVPEKSDTSTEILRDVPVDLDQTDLSEEQKAEVREMLKKYSHAFAFSKSELGTAEGVFHRIRLTDEQPFKDRPRRIPPAFFNEVKDQIEEMLACGAIRHSNSPYSSNVVLVRKHDGSLRLCLDFRKLNAKTIRDAYNIPRIDDILDRLAGSKWFSCLDLQSGYWQVQVEEQDRAKTAFFIQGLGHFECNRMPFGLTNAPATFQRLTESKLVDLPFCQVFLDDIIVFSETFEDQLVRLEKILQRIVTCGLKLKPSKCHLFRRRVKYLGHVISEAGVETDAEKIQSIVDWPVPVTVQDLRRALGFFGYYRRYVKGYSIIAKPLHELLRGHENTTRTNKKTFITLDAAALEAFSTLKSKLSEPPILGYADYSLPFELHTDASQVGLGAVLYQRQNGKLRVIAYASRGLKPSESRYSAHKLEFLALKWAVCEKFNDYLYGQGFTVFTDNNPLSYVLTTAKLDATGYRWLANLSTFSFDIKYRSGKQNADADALSRLPGAELSEETVTAICNGILVAQEDSVADIICLQQQASGVTLSEAAGHLTKDDWRKLQGGEEILGILRKAVQDQKKPRKEVVNNYPDLKIYLREWDKLFLQEDILYRKTQSSTGEDRKQLLLPACKKKEVLRGLHNDLGHLGRDRTTELVRSRFFWPHLADDVKNWVKCCEPCVKRKISIPDRAPLVNIRTTQPLELVCIDYLSLEPAKGGVENILVITDHFTRFAHAIPTRNQTAKTTATALYSFFLHYGFPQVLHSDQGRNFESALIKDLCKLVGITKSRTTPYHAMGNGMTERFNHTLLNMMGTLEEDKKRDWKTYVPALVQAYNATKHDSTGYSPFFLMLGRHPRLPIDVVMGIHPEEDQKETDYVRSLRDRMQYAFEVATRNATKATGSHKKNYDRRIRGGTVQVGDRVLVRNTGIRGKSKLANRWEDTPYTVLDQPDPDIPVFVVQQDGRRKAKRTLHRNMLLPINFLPLPDTLGAVGPTKTAPDVTITEQDIVKEETTQEETLSEEDDESQSDISVEYVLNPLAPEFHPQQFTSDESIISTSSSAGEDPQMAGLSDVVEDSVAAADASVLVDDVDAVDQVEEMAAGGVVDRPVRGEDEAEEEVDEDSIVEEELAVSLQADEEDSQLESDDEDEQFEEAVEDLPVTPAIRNRPQRIRRPPDYFRPDDYAIHQQVARPPANPSFEHITSFMEMQNKCLLELVHLAGK